jgi:hypothetical protein
LCSCLCYHNQSRRDTARSRQEKRFTPVFLVSLISGPNRESKKREKDGKKGWRKRERKGEREGGKKRRKGGRERERERKIGY